MSGIVKTGPLHQMQAGPPAGSPKVVYDQKMPPMFDPKQYRDNGLPEHALAFIELLEKACREVRAGEAVHDVADRIELTIKIAARRI